MWKAEQPVYYIETNVKTSVGEFLRISQNANV